MADLITDATLNSGSISLTVKWDTDGDGSADGSETVSISDGTNTTQLSNAPDDALHYTLDVDISGAAQLHSAEVDTPLDATRSVTSHTGTISSFPTSDRTSLELLDYDVSWDDSTATWYTPWVRLTRILGNEDQVGLISQVVDGADDSEATVRVQYSTNKQDVVWESQKIQVGPDERLRVAEGIPIDEGGWYRLSITDYGGYNSLYSLDFAFIR